MTEPLVSIHFDENRRTFFPGESLAGYFRIESVVGEHISAIEISVLWQSEGKGDTDLRVHDFSRIVVREGELIDPSHPNHFATTLPESPLSYDGVLIRIRWLIRIRVFLQGGESVVGEKEFRLGEVPSTGPATRTTAGRSR